MSPVRADVWSSVLDHIQRKVGEQRHSLWFRNIRPIQTEGDVIVLGVPNLFVQEWLETHLLDVLRQGLQEQLGRVPVVRFHIDPALFRESREATLQAEADIVTSAAVCAKPSAADKGGVLRPDFTLEHFVVGPSNKLAYACAMEILESKSNNLHPLFIHGMSGLGKSHLMQGLLNAIRKRDDGRTAEYISAETFTNEFIYALRANRLDAFRHKYRTVDVLLIDDVHFLSNKNRLQEEFLHTYDAIDSGNKQLILASDVHPKMLAKIKQSLVNRFASGMIVRIAPPDFSTRVAILKTKAQQQRRRLPDEVLRYIARGFEGSIRDLTGALTMIQAYAGLTGEKPDITLARTALNRLERPAAEQRTGFHAVERVVAQRYSLTPEALRGKHLPRSTRQARQVCMYLARQCTNMSVREIAHQFGSIHHSTVLFAVRRVEELMKKDRNLAELVSAMTEQLRRA